jgi:regulator of replication initiation timing
MSILKNLQILNQGIKSLEENWGGYELSGEVEKTIESKFNLEINKKQILYVLKSKTIKKLIKNKKYDKIVKYSWDTEQGNMSMFCLYVDGYSFHIPLSAARDIICLNEKTGTYHLEDGYEIKTEETNYNGWSKRQKIKIFDFEKAILGIIDYIS